MSDTLREAPTAALTQAMYLGPGRAEKVARYVGALAPVIDAAIRDAQAAAFDDGRAAQCLWEIHVRDAERANVAVELARFPTNPYRDPTPRSEP